MNIDGLIKNIKTLGPDNEQFDCNNIALCADENYIPYVGIAIASIMKVSKEKLCFHIFSNNINENNIKKFHNIAEQEGQTIILYEIDDSLFNKISLSKENSHVSSATFYRFIIPCILYKRVKRILYLDVDICCLRDIDSIFKLELENNVVAVVEDISESRNCKRLHVKRYFNAGVILIDVEKWTETKIAEQCFELAHRIKFSFLDQDILNIILEDNALFVDRKFNSQYSLSKLIDEVDQPSNASIPEGAAIVHFIGASKPWHAWVQCCKVVKVYNKMKCDTDWKDLKPVKPNNYKMMHKAARCAKKERDFMNMIYWYVKYGISKIKFYMK